MVSDPTIRTGSPQPGFFGWKIIFLEDRAMAQSNTFKEILLAKWVPALITALIGGALVAYLAPAIQTKFTQSSTLEKRKLELWESIGENFTNYILWRGRLNSAAIAERSYEKERRTVPKEFLLRKENYLTERDKYANLLRRDLLLANFYFQYPEAKEKINKFLDWHAKFRIATVDQLPPDEEYIKWRDDIMETIRSKLK